MNIQESCSIVESSNHLIITHELISFIYSTQLNSTQLNSTDTHPWTTDRVRRPWGKNWTNLPQPENIRLSSGQRAGHPFQSKSLEICCRYCWSWLLITEPVLYWYSIGFVCWFDLIWFVMIWIVPLFIIVHPCLVHACYLNMFIIHFIIFRCVIIIRPFLSFLSCPNPTLVKSKRVFTVHSLTVKFYK